MVGTTTTERREHFSRLIAEAEESFKRNPAAYRRKLMMLAALGYVYIFGVLLFTVLLIALCVLGAIYSHVMILFLVKSKLIFALFFIFYVLIKSLWVKLEAPSGYKLKRKDAPLLFAAVDDLGKQLKAPRIHKILLTHEFNAAISQTPRLGIFGWQRNTLIIGLQLMMGMDRGQFLSVIAHEFGHLSGNHSRFAGWIYRVRITWLRIMAAFDQAGGWAHRVFGRFFDWYAPYFNAYSFALARANEYEADAVAVAMTSSQDFTGSLVQTHVAPELLQQHYWSGVERQVRDRPEVNEAIYTGLREGIKELPFDSSEVDLILDKAMHVQTGDADTHPALRDRIAPYVKSVPRPALPRRSAAEELLGDQLPVVLKAYDEKWADYNRQWWQERHAYLNKSREELAQLEQKQQEQELNDEELWNLAAWTEELKPEVDPLPVYQQWVQRHPDNPGVNFAIGRILLAREQQEGLAHLEKALGDYQYTIPACEQAWMYYNGKGESARAEEYRLQAERHLDLQRQAEYERANLYEHDEYEKAGLSEEWIKYIRDQIAQYPGVKETWISRKHVKTFPESPVYVLINTYKWRQNGDKLDQQIADTLKMPSTFFVTNTRKHKKIAKKALMVATEVYIK